MANGTNQILHALNEDGSYKFEKVDVEIQHASALFKRIPDVFELEGTKRFVDGDPLVDFLKHMRDGSPFP